VIVVTKEEHGKDDDEVLMRWVCEGTAKHLDTADHYDERCYAVSTRQHTDNQHIKLEDSTW